ncbi:zinc-finger domain-containing protein [Bartonella sp. A05]|uniref:zinc-finger domain-containing protein n=1 Tax=Bartonella sp. A05 TaxID=2967261 RepID=UPI0022A94B64|nr:zinc-finger domain-containing protein [Bartonella sp. A05]MCZ2204384.1 zinc-finger domain-containing protein [Bartonella sp. A05]
MADHHIPHFQNDHGYKTIEIGVKKFMCVGATQPFDHPHVFIDMGAADETICPYCSTLYRYNRSLPYNQTNPLGCTYHADNTL